MNLFHYLINNFFGKVISSGFVDVRKHTCFKCVECKFQPFMCACRFRCQCIAITGFGNS